MIRRTLWLAALLAAPSLTAAQERPVPAPPPMPGGPPAAQQAPAPLPTPTVGPPIQRIATASSMSTERLGAITSVHELPDGRVLVNDGMRRRLLVMDSTLQHVEVVLDSISAVANTYGTRAGALLPYRADSVLFMDPASYAMVVLDPSANVVRVRSVWRVEDTFQLTSGSFYGWPGLDARGRIVYRVNAIPAPPKVAPPAGVPWIPVQPDSAFVVAVDIDTRRIDTLTSVRVAKTDMRVRRNADGGLFIEPVVNPLPLVDDWAVLPDGRVAVLRGIDYRIEYLNPDGSWTSSQKLPYEWQRLSDDDKDRMVDSVRTTLQQQAFSQYLGSIIRWVNQYNRNYPVNFNVPPGTLIPPGLPRDWILPRGLQFPENYIYACPPGVEPTPPTPAQMAAAMGRPVEPGSAAPADGPAPCLPAPITFSSGNVPPMPTLRNIHTLPAGDLPDYKPPIPAGAVRADMEGNLWIRANQTQAIPGGTVYDIVDPAGELVARYHLPTGYTIVGFGRDKVVYLSLREATGLKLARVRLR